MKVLLINGSPHATGSTYTALHEMEKVFGQEGLETELVQVGNKISEDVLPVELVEQKENVYLMMW